jgi:hypothetical protein
MPLRAALLRDCFKGQLLGWIGSDSIESDPIQPIFFRLAGSPISLIFLCFPFFPGRQMIPSD